jgi:hypothetical protein
MTAALTRTFSRTAIAVWALLVVATLTSWYLGADHGVAGSTTAASCAIILIAGIKARFVGRYFMDVRSAPTILRVACDLWCAGMCAAFISLYAFN